MSIKWLKSKQVKKKRSLRSFLRFRIPLDVCPGVCSSPFGTVYKHNLSAETLQDSQTLRHEKLLLCLHSWCSLSTPKLWIGKVTEPGRKMKLIWKLVKDSKRISSEIVILTPRYNKQGGMICTKALWSYFGCRLQDLVQFSCLRYMHAFSLPHHKHRRCLVASLDLGWCIY